MFDRFATAEEIAPKGWRTAEERDKIAREIEECLDLGKQVKGDLSERIRRNTDLAENINIPVSLPWEGADSFHIPLVGPKLQQRKAAIVSTITSQDTIFRLTPVGSRERADRVEQVLQFFLDAGDFDTALDRAAWLAMVANTAIWRVTFQHHARGYESATHTGTFAGIVFDVIHPDYFMVFPGNSVSLDQSRVHGHAFDARMAEIQEGIADGRYFDVKPTADQPYTDELRAPTGGTELQNRPAPQLDGDKNVRVWDLLWRWSPKKGEPEQMYRVLFCEDPASILFVEPYNAPSTWYVPMSFKEEWGRFWANGSPAQDVQGLQLLLNGVANSYIWGSLSSTRPPVLTEGMSTQDSVKSYRPGEMVEVRSVGRSMPLPISFNPSGLGEIIQMVQGFADSASRTSDALTGAPANAREATATEQNIRWEAFRIGSSDDIVQISPALRRIAVRCLDLLHRNFSTWSRVYPQIARPYADGQPFDQASLVEPLTVALAGSSPEDSPQMQAQQAQQLLQMAMEMPNLSGVIAELLSAIVLATSLPNKDRIASQIAAAFSAPQVVPGMDQGVPGMDPAMQGAAPAEPEGGPLEMDPETMALLAQLAGGSENGLLQDDGMGNGQMVPPGGDSY